MTSAPLHASDYTWSGPSNTSYDTATNWTVGGSPATVPPGAGDNFTVSTNTVINLGNSDYSINNITNSQTLQLNYVAATPITYNILGSIYDQLGTLSFRGQYLTVNLSGNAYISTGAGLFFGAGASGYTPVATVSQSHNSSIIFASSGSALASNLLFNSAANYNVGTLDFGSWTNTKYVYLDANAIGQTSSSAPIIATVGGLSGSSGSIQIYGAQDLSTSGSALHGAHYVTLNISNTADYATTAVMADYVTGSAGAMTNAYTNSVLSVTKTGTGTQKFSGASTYSGGTTVQQGRLVVNNTTGSGTGTGAVTVSNGATLAGTGIIAPTAGNNVTINGTLAPGDTTGTLTFNLSSGSKLAFGSGSTLSLTLDTASSSVAFSSAGDWLTGSGNVSLSLSLGTGFSYSNTYNIFTGVTTTGFTFASITGYDTSSYTANVTQSGTAYTLSFSAVPEPSTYAFLIGGLALFVLSRRRMAATFQD
ncbi:MAG: autotransporter-associated beta strand repeat-containing protein [Verrucomicrobium sp.]|nr:autotransporter-associated beta strand repeat-containing protein [Verrucomicrobium sp.]